MRVIEAPPAEREAVYQTIRDSLRESQSVFPVDPEFEEQYMTWLRSLVAIIESGEGRDRIKRVSSARQMALRAGVLYPSTPLREQREPVMPVTETRRGNWC